MCVHVYIYIYTCDCISHNVVSINGEPLQEKIYVTLCTFLCTQKSIAKKIYLLLKMTFKKCLLYKVEINAPAEGLGIYTIEFVIV